MLIIAATIWTSNSSNLKGFLKPPSTCDDYEKICKKQGDEKACQYFEKKCVTPPPTPACVPGKEACDNKELTCKDYKKMCKKQGDEKACQYFEKKCVTPPPTPACVPEAEACDNRDNDCNGAIDENLSRSCSNECGNTGTQTCVAGGWNACTVAACPEPVVEEEEEDYLEDVVEEVAVDYPKAQLSYRCKVVAYNGTQNQDAFAYEISLSATDKNAAESECAVIGANPANIAQACNFPGSPENPPGDGTANVFMYTTYPVGSLQNYEYCNNQRDPWAAIDNSCLARANDIGWQIGIHICPNGCRYCE